MAETQLLKVLLAHDRWATGELLDACSGLPDAAFHRRFEMGWGSLHDTLTHILGALYTYTDTLAEQPDRPQLERDGQRRSVDELRAVMQDAYDGFEAEALRLPLATPVVRRLRDGRTVPLTRASVVAHVATHSTHHRSQCLNMLRHLGQPIPPSGLAEWIIRYGGKDQP